MSGGPREAPHATGRCLCGAVSFEVRAPLGRLSFCHCSMCRRMHTHVGAYASASRDAVVVHGEEALRWYRSSERVRRGFCGTCGSGLFFDREGARELEIAAGGLETPTGLRVKSHIYVASKGDYYDLPEDGLPRWDEEPR